MTAERAGWKRIERKTIQVYRLAFSYRGQECREHLTLPHSKANDAYVARRRAAVLHAIETGTFNYATEFPDSARAAGAGAAKLDKLGPLLRAWVLRNKATLEPSTWIGYHNATENKLIPYFGPLRPRDLRVSNIREWVGLQTSSLKTIANVLLPLRAVLDELVEDEVLEINPLRVARIGKMVPVAKRTSEFVADPFTRDEVTRVLLALAPADLPPFLFWAHTGVRSGELIGLTWKRVDLETGRVRIQETTTIGKDKERPKTKAGVRTFTMLPAARQALARALLIGLPAYGEDGARNDRVFQRATSRMPGHAWGYNTLNATWKEACERAGVRYRNTYQLRHTFASQLRMDGRPDIEIANLLGHKTTEMVTRVYGKFMAGKREVAWGSMLLEPNAADGWREAA